MSFRNTQLSDTMTLASNKTLTLASTSFFVPTAGFTSYVIGLGPGSNAGGAGWLQAQIAHALIVGTGGQAVAVAEEDYEIKTNDGTAGAGRPATLSGTLKGDAVEILISVDGGLPSSAAVTMALTSNDIGHDGRLRPNNFIAGMPQPPRVGLGGSSELEIYSINQIVNAGQQLADYMLPFSGPVTMTAFTDAPANAIVIAGLPGHGGSPVIGADFYLQLPTGRSNWGPFYLPRRQSSMVITNTDVSNRTVSLLVVGAD